MPEGWRAAAIYTLIETGKFNDVDPQAWRCYSHRHEVRPYWFWCEGSCEE